MLIIVQGKPEGQAALGGGEEGPHLDSYIATPRVKHKALSAILLSCVNVC